MPKRRTNLNLAAGLMAMLTMLAGCRASTSAVSELPPADETIRWRSAATETILEGHLFRPSPQTKRPAPTIAYLTNLSIPRIGRESDGQIIRGLLAQGCIVLVLDYARHARAVSPLLNADVLKLRREIAGKERLLLVDEPVDPNRLFILAEGFRLTHDVVFAHDGDRVLAMDVLHPATPTVPVPLLMEITCDNVDRMGAFSLLYCEDTLVEGAQFAGFAAAMVDHPVAPPYKGIDSMPANLFTMQSAVRKARSLGRELGLSGKIGVIGFSRGGVPAAMLAARGNGDSAVQAALVHGNRYDYLDLLPGDPMRARFEAAWGSPDTSRQRWIDQGVVGFVGRDTAPMFLNTSIAESAEYRHGLERLHQALERAGVEHEYQVDSDARGHKVATDPATLRAIYAFFHKHLRRR